MRKRLLCPLFLLIGTSTATGQRNAPPEQSNGPCLSANAGSVQKAYAFLADLQSAMKRDDRKRVARMVHYPLRFYGKGRGKIRSSAELLRRYDEIFLPVKEVVLIQKPENLFCNWKGIMIGRGEIWFDEKIVTVNRPWPKQK